MSEEEIKGILRMIQDRQDTIIQILNRMENRQIEVKTEIEAEPAQGSLRTVNQ